MRRNLALTLAVAAVLGTGGLALAQDGSDRPAAREQERQRRAERGQADRQMVERFDKDGDGRLNDDERAAAFDAQLEERPQLRQRLLERFDADKDGALSADEKAAARASMQERRGGGDGEGAGPGGGRRGPGEGRGGPGGPGAGPGGGPAMLDRLIDQVDKDGDGELSGDEIDALKAQVRTRHAERLRQFDADGDGKLSPQERRAARPARPARGGADGADDAGE